MTDKDDNNIDLDNFNPDEYIKSESPLIYHIH